MIPKRRYRLTGIPTWLRESRTFHLTKRERDSRNVWKDSATNPILRSIGLPKDANVLLMPGKYGPEVEIMKDKGVPLDRIWTIEYVPPVHAFQKTAGLHVTPGPMEFTQAIPFIEAQGHDGFHLMYFDLQTLMTRKYMETLGYILDKRMIRSRGTLVISSGRSSYPIKEALELDSDVRSRYPDWPSFIPPTPKLVEELLFQRWISWSSSGHKPYRNASGIWHVVSWVRF